jgi:hypothetical protein
VGIVLNNKLLNLELETAVIFSSNLFIDQYDAEEKRYSLQLCFAVYNPGTLIEPEIVRK